MRGKMMPIETVPSPAGSVWLDVMRVAHVVGKLQPAPPGQKMYVAHFATCPGANAHRKPKDSVPGGAGLSSEPPGLKSADRPDPKRLSPQGDLFGRGKP